MKTRYLILSLIVAAAIGTAVSTAPSPTPPAAPPLMYLDWSAATFAPLTYTDVARTPAVPNSRVTVWTTLFDEQTVKKSKTDLRPIHVPRDTSHLSYKWFLNGKNVVGGIGASSFTFSIPYGIITDGYSVECWVLDAVTNTIIQTAQITVPVARGPQVLVHQVKGGKFVPLTQLSFSGVPQETLSLIAEPYFFAVTSIDNLTFRWYRHDIQIDPSTYQDNRWEITLPAQQTSETFSSVVYNTSFDLELLQQSFTVSVP